MKRTKADSQTAQETSQPESVEHKAVEKHSMAMEKHLLNALLDDLPDYIYFKDTESRFIRISKSHAKAFGLSDPAEAIGKSDTDFFSEEHARQAYEDEQEIIRTGKTLSKEEKETWPDRHVTWVLTTKAPLHDEEGKIIGTFGISKDITEEKRLREIFEDLQKDIGRTFHTFSATLIQATHAIIPTINALASDSFKEGLFPEAEGVWKELVGLRNGVVSALSKLLESIESPFQRDALPPWDWAELEKLVSLLSEVERIHVAELRAPVLRRVARRVIDILSKIKKSSIRQELLREVRRSAEQLERMTCLIALRQAQNRIVDTDYMVRDLRERVLTGIKQSEKPESYEFWDLVQEAIEGLSEYAGHKGVEFRKDNRSDNAHVWVVRRDIVRVVNNLLHNAIKYSWSRDKSVKPWIEIRSYVEDDRVYVEIEDYGVPIPRDEIEGDLIFQLGFRGRLSGQRGRIGTGIGLVDARDMARRYRGEVALDSHPATRNLSPDDFTIPHLKTATLFLPIFKRSGGRK